METFGAWMRQLLVDEGLSQEAAARKLGVSLHTVNRWATGRTEPRLQELRKIYDTFGRLPFDDRDTLDQLSRQTAGLVAAM